MTVVRIDVRVLSHFGDFQEFAEFREGAGFLEEEVETVLLALLCGGVTLSALCWALCLFLLLFFYPGCLSSSQLFLLLLFLFRT